MDTYRPVHNHPVIIQDLHSELSKASGERAKVALNKLDYVLNKNVSHKLLCGMQRIMAGGTYEFGEDDLSLSQICNLKYAPVTSCDVERSFSSYKNILSDRRHRLTPLNIEMILLEDMLTLGCSQQPKIALAYQVYMDLCETHLLWDISYSYCKDLDLIIFTGRRSKCSPFEIYVPIAAKSELSILQVEDLQRALCTEQVKGLTLAIKAKDSTVVLYRMQQGLITPEHPDDTKRKKQLKDNRFNVESELRRNKQTIFMRAQGIEFPREDELTTVQENDSPSNNQLASAQEIVPTCVNELASVQEIDDDLQDAQGIDDNEFLGEI